MPEYVQLYDDEPAEEAPAEEAAAQTKDEDTPTEEASGEEPAGSKNTPKTEVHDDVAEARKLMAE